MKDPTNRGQTYQIALREAMVGLSTSIDTRPQEDALTQPGTGDMVGDILSVPCVSFRLLCCFPL